MKSHLPTEIPAVGRFTLPGESGKEALVRDPARRWGADAIRDSDGTALCDSLLEVGLEVYSNPRKYQLDTGNDPKRHWQVIDRSTGEGGEAPGWHCANPHTGCAWHPEVGKLIVLNNSLDPQATSVACGDGSPLMVALAPYESQWFAP